MVAKAGAASLAYLDASGDKALRQSTVAVAQGIFLAAQWQRCHQPFLDFGTFAAYCCIFKMFFSATRGTGCKEWPRPVCALFSSCRWLAIHSPKAAVGF